MNTNLLMALCFSLYCAASTMEYNEMTSKNWQAAEKVAAEYAKERMKRYEIEALEQALIDAPEHEKALIVKKLRELTKWTI